MAIDLTFISKVAPIIQRLAPQYGILVCSPVIGQAILESGWGKSKLSETYHNYFGLKCGSKWTGKSVNLTTKEEYTVGVKSTIRDNFRVYDSMEDGIKGYFEFIQLERYSNLRGITDPETYLSTIKADGYCTSSTYVSDVMAVINKYELTKYDKEVSTMTDSEIKICGHGSGNPSTKNLHTYSEQRYESTFTYNGKTYRKGIIRVRRLKELTDPQRVAFHDTYATIIGRNIYSQDLRNYCYKPYSNGKYYSDCSSSGMYTLKQVCSSNLAALNTVGILNSALFEDVPVTITKGHIMNPEVLKVGDAILFAGNKARPASEFCGHVEWVYTTPNGSSAKTEPTSAAASTSKTCSVTPRVLEKGMQGNDVKLMQGILISEGFNLGKAMDDGDFGDKTRSALIAWQTKHASEVGSADGVFGKKCWTYILRA